MCDAEIGSEFFCFDSGHVTWVSYLQEFSGSERDFFVLC